MASVSVLIVSRGQATLDAAIHTALQQRHAPGEILVGLPEGQSPGRWSEEGLLAGAVRTLQVGPLQGAARNQLASAARGAWLAFLDAGDGWAPEKLAQQLAALDAAEASWSYTGWHEAGGTIAEPRAPLSDLLSERGIPASSVLVSRGAFWSAGGLPDEVGGEVALWFRLALREPAAVVPAPLTSLGRQPRDAAQARAARQAALAALDAARTAPHFPRGLRLRAWLTSAAWQHEAAILALATDDHTAAAAHAMAALRQNPLHPGYWRTWLRARQSGL